MTLAKINTIPSVDLEKISRNVAHDLAKNALAHI